jgi:hypothetical protein
MISTAPFWKMATQLYVVPRSTPTTGPIGGSSAAEQQAVTSKVNVNERCFRMVRGIVTWRCYMYYVAVLPALKRRFRCPGST